MSIEKLQPADRGEVSLYMPYCPAGAKRAVLPQAITLYKKGSLEGNRKIEGGESIPFVATWLVSRLPADLTRLRLQFDGNAELSYEITLANSEFIIFLIEVIVTYNSVRTTDFPQSFYRRLLRLEE
jgi:hypothetical protein